MLVAGAIEDTNPALYNCSNGMVARRIVDAVAGPYPNSVDILIEPAGIVDVFSRLAPTSRANTSLGRRLHADIDGLFYTCFDTTFKWVEQQPFKITGGGKTITLFDKTTYSSEGGMIPFPGFEASKNGFYPYILINPAMCAGIGLDFGDDAFFALKIFSKNDEKIQLGVGLGLKLLTVFKHGNKVKFEKELMKPKGLFQVKIPVPYIGGITLKFALSLSALAQVELYQLTGVFDASVQYAFTLDTGFDTRRTGDVAYWEFDGDMSVNPPNLAISSATASLGCGGAMAGGVTPAIDVIISPSALDAALEMYDKVAKFLKKLDFSKLIKFPKKPPLPANVKEVEVFMDNMKDITNLAKLSLKGEAGIEAPLRIPAKTTAGKQVCKTCDKGKPRIAFEPNLYFKKYLELTPEGGLRKLIQKVPGFGSGGVPAVKFELGKPDTANIVEPKCWDLPALFTANQEKCCTGKSFN